MGDAEPTGDGSREAADLVATLTRGEKLRLVRGAYPDWEETKPGAAGYLSPIPRLEVPALRFEDGPLGVKSADGTGFPSALALGASFDTGLAERLGEAMGAEARAHGVDVLLAPGCNLVRVPHCGRNFEYYGEDPHHTAGLTAATVRGIQSQGVVATPKHYVANNQEHERVSASAEVDERALRELYLPAFEAAVADGDAGAVMAAYNRVNGAYATEHRELLTDVLKDEFGFDGPVVSDWWAVQDGPRAASAGLDLEMPGVGAIDWAVMLDERLGPLRVLERHWPDAVPGPEEAAAWLFENKGGPGGDPSPRRSAFARTLPRALERGALTADRLDDMAERVLTLHARVGALDGDRRRRRSVDVDRSAHRDLARRIATRGTVLLKNADGTLPLDPDASVAAIGPHVDAAKTGGGGSSEVWDTETVSPLAGLRRRSRGPVRAARGHPPIGRRLPVDLERALPSIGPFGTDGTASIDAARAAAADADVAGVVVQDAAGEGRDRDSLSLPGDQDALISAVADVAERTVVALQTAGPVETPWLDAVDAVLEAWYPGQEAGAALAAVLYGDVDPGGRLPVTFATAADYPTAVPERYPGLDGADGYPEVRYGEGVFVGYRYFDAREVDPLFPFGHGLSYATFAYRDLEAALEGTEPSVSVTVENVGDRRGREVVQVYARPRDASVRRPPRELAGFAALSLEVGERRTVDVGLDERAFAVYDTTAGDWVTDADAFALECGRSSRDIRERVAVELDGEAVTVGSSEP